MPMSSHRSKGLPDDLERRGRGGRFQAKDLRSSLGPVLNFSIAGLAVVNPSSHEKLIGEETTIHLWIEKGEKFEFRAQIRSSKKIGFRKHRVGLAFVGLTPEQRMMLTEFGSRAGSHEFGWGLTG